MAWPSSSSRTKNWSTEILTDADLESQFDILHTYFNDSLNASTGHGHTGGTADGPKLNIAAALSIASQAQGDILYASSATVWARLGAGTSGQFLQTQGASANPQWATVIPTGIISLWYGSIATIPSGWVLCDGTNSTPDLRNLFVVGADADSGGAAKSTITGSALQTHTTGIVGTHVHPVKTSNTTVGGTTYVRVGVSATQDTSQNTDANTGANAKNIPPFYALAYIMKT